MLGEPARGTKARGASVRHRQHGGTLAQHGRGMREWELARFYKKSAPGEANKRTRTASNGGCGFPRQKFESVQVALRSMVRLEFSLSWASRGAALDY